VNEATLSKTVLTLAWAALLLFASDEMRAAAQGPTPPEVKPAAPEAKLAAEGEETKTEPGEPAKPEESSPSTEAEGSETPPQGEGAPLSLAELTRDGFEIRATDFVPAEAVTRHSGKVSFDAVIVTLQKTDSTAICFYTLKAYVGKTLTTIPACTVHR
jgi:hypothetical protein